MATCEKIQATSAARRALWTDRAIARRIAIPMLGAALAALLATACNPIVGFKDPKLDRPMQTDDAAIDAEIHDAPPDMASTITCPASCTFGCEADMVTCRPAKLWVYLSRGQYAGNGFGGQHAPADVRKTSSSECFLTASDKYPALACKQSLSFAVLTIDGTDNIPTMSGTFNIPTNVAVHRADDDVLVADTWGDLTNTTQAVLHANAVSNAAAGGDDPAPGTSTTAPGVVWTGIGGGSTCSNWQSAGMSGQPADLGVEGRTRFVANNGLPPSNWTNRGSFACNLLEPLLCVCWSGRD